MEGAAHAIDRVPDPRRQPQRAMIAEMHAQITTRHDVVSSVISSVGYGPDATLDVEFRNGAVYRYFMVPHSTFTAFVEAESKGSYLNRYIKGAFRHTRLR